MCAMAGGHLNSRGGSRSAEQTSVKTRALLYKVRGLKEIGFVKFSLDLHSSMGICILREMHGNRLQCMLYSLQCGRISYSYNLVPFRSVSHFLALFALALERVHADLLVVLLQGSHVLAGLGELALLHADLLVVLLQGSHVLA